MATNPALDYGLDVGCQSDADDLFTEVSGLALLEQDILHVATQEDFLGPGGDARGFDSRTLIGKKDADLDRYAPILAQVIADDDRVLTVNVTLTAIKTRGLDDVRITISGTSELGPFDLTKSVLEITEADLEALTV